MDTSGPPPPEPQPAKQSPPSETEDRADAASPEPKRFENARLELDALRAILSSLSPDSLDSQKP